MPLTPIRVHGRPEIICQKREFPQRISCAAIHSSRGVACSSATAELQARTRKSAMGKAEPARTIKAGEAFPARRGSGPSGACRALERALPAWAGASSSGPRGPARSAARCGGTALVRAATCGFSGY